MNLGYPEYKREEKLQAKLTDKEVEKIKEEYAITELSMYDLASKYHVNQSTIWCIVNPEKAKIRRHKSHLQRVKKGIDKLKKSLISSRSQKRKLNLKTKEFMAYRAKKNRLYNLSRKYGN